MFNQTQQQAVSRSYLTQVFFLNECEGKAILRNPDLKIVSLGESGP